VSVYDWSQMTTDESLFEGPYEQALTGAGLREITCLDDDTVLSQVRKTVVVE
jgi:hypothetical protein